MDRMHNKHTSCGENKTGCNVIVSKQPSLEKLLLRFCETHTEVISYTRPATQEHED